MAEQSQRASQDSTEFDVFLCHNSKDKPAVREICRQLKQHAIEPWLDEEQLRPGLPWQRLLDEQIGQIKAAAVFVGREGVGPWQQEEIEAFLNEFVDRGCPVIPVVLADASSVPALPRFLKNRTWVDFRQSESNPLERLIWGVTGKKLGIKPEIDVLVEVMREEIRSLIQERCGTMRVLHMTQPIRITGEQGIYTDVKILRKISGRISANNIDHLKTKVAKQFRFNDLPTESVPGIEVVQKHQRLILLGQPGAGKTTFLKYLAIRCIEGDFQNNRVPFFIALKDFVNTSSQLSLLDYIQQYLGNEDSRISDLLKHGRALILLDGLDEIYEDIERLVSDINGFLDRFPNNQVVITCRLAAQEYVFERFTEVELAQFNDKQIISFIQNWFRCKDLFRAKEISSSLIIELQKNSAIKELASNPLLLTLLCLECEDSLEFPRNRAELYEKGLRVLLSRWDASRGIQRDRFYKDLSTRNKENLLSQFALKSFDQKEFFFKQRTIEQHIADYMMNLHDSETDSRILQINSEAALRSIEAQHGLLVERARGIYSFSHLTFQEYFVAKEIVNRGDYEKLARNITQKRWREIFRLVVDLLPDSTRLMLIMKQEVDALLPDERLQQYLEWLRKKTVLMTSRYKPASVRAFYFILDFSLNLECTLDSAVNHNIALDKTHNLSFAYPHTLAYIHNLVLKLDEAYERAFALSKAIDSKIDRALDSGQLQCDLLNLCDALPNFSNQNLEGLKQWQKTDSQKWLEKLKSIVMQHRDIARNWQFSEEQRGQLQQYYATNKLLVDCLNSDCYVSRDVRQEIEETLLLPIAEIEKRKIGAKS